jgi:hypothetical protein
MLRFVFLVGRDTPLELHSDSWTGPSPRLMLGLRYENHQAYPVYARLAAIVFGHPDERGKAIYVEE